MFSVGKACHSEGISLSLPGGIPLASDNVLTYTGQNSMEDMYGVHE